MSENSNRSEISLHSSADDWMDSEKPAVNRWWWFWNKPPMGRAVFMLVSIPVYYALIWYIGSTADKHYADLLRLAQKNVFLAFLLWGSIVAVARSICNEHLRHALSARVTDAGVELRNRFDSHMIRWASVKHVLPTIEGEYLVSTTDGEYFFPADQKWSLLVVDRLRKEAGIAPENHTVVMTADPKYKMKLLLVSIPLLFVFLYQALKPLIQGTPFSFGYFAAVLLFAVPIALVFGFFAYVQIYRTPKLFVVGESVLVVDGDGEHRFSVEQIKSVRFLGAMGWISTSKGSWAISATNVVDHTLPNIPFPKSTLKTKKEAIKKAKLLIKGLAPKRLR